MVDFRSTQMLVNSALLFATCLILYDLLTNIYLHITAAIILYIVYRVLAKRNAKKIEIKGQGVFITGCDTGFGHEIALRLAKVGFTVFAGCLKPEGEGAKTLIENGGDRLHVVPLDVTDDACVNKALEIVRKKIPETGIWAVINNAAIEFAAEIEFARMETMKRVFEVNYYGVVRVTKAFLPLIRQSKGRVVNVSSVKGRLAVARDTAYVSAKWAVEAFSDILRRELYRFGVKVAIIEPGQFGGVTSILQGERLELAEAELNLCWTQASENIKAAYGRESIDSLINDLRNDCKGSSKDINPVIDAMQDAVENVHPKCRYLIHGSNKLMDKFCVLSVLNQYLPEPVLDFFYRIFFPLPKVKRV